MEWVAELRGSIIGLDTAPLIYLIEERPICLPALQAFFGALSRGEFTVVTSALTLTEVLVHPFRQKNYGLAEEYRRILLHASHIETLPVSGAIAEEAARLRAMHNFRTPIVSGASAFLTNDARLAELRTPKVLVLNNLVSLS